MKLLISFTTVLLGLCSHSVFGHGNDTPLHTNITLNFLIQNAVTAGAFNNAPNGRVGGRTEKEFEQVAARITKNSAKYFENGSKFGAPIDKLVTIYCQNSATEQTAVTLDTIELVTKPSQGFVFILHGWADTYKVYYVDELTKAYLSHIGDTNICVVDYGPIAQTEPFQIAQPHSFAVAEYISKFVHEVSMKFNVPLSLFTFIGHGLGAHIAGVVGNRLSGKLSAIYATDPCGLGCSKRWSAVDNSLHAFSAQYVQTIATNRNKLGPAPDEYKGVQVFWPNNGGPDQPGCGYNSILCAHYRAVDYLIASFDRKNEFSGRHCDTEEKLKGGGCDYETCDRMGVLAAGTVRGNFFLFTDAEPPFADKDGCPFSDLLVGFYDKKNRQDAIAYNKWNEVFDSFL